MLLRTVKIENFRSLEDVNLEGLGEFNILVGRNNAGKSSIFEALAYLARMVFGRGATSASDSEVLTDHDSARQLRISLTLGLEGDERAEFVQRLVEAGIPEVRRDELIDGQVLQQVRYVFEATAGTPHSLRLVQTRMLAEDGRWATIRGYVPNAADALEMRQVDLRTVGSTLPIAPLSAERIDVFRANNLVGPSAPDLADLSTSATLRRHLDSWFFGVIMDYVATTFFFSAFRHASETLPAAARLKLASDGTDLPIVLNYLSGADQPKFQAIQQFVQQAVPEIGTLHPGLIRAESAGAVAPEVRITFRQPSGTSVPLRQMGGGVEELLMAATVMATEGNAATLFLEEPETHLHPGAQRYLADHLRTGVKQAFLATHSPIFVNVPSPRSIYRIAIAAGRTTVARVSEAEGLAQALEDIGSRNSDVLLSDAVLFVEGPADRDVFEAWSRSLGTSLEENGLTILPMGGGAHAATQAPLRSEILWDISNRAGIPHLFILDRDERGQQEIASLQARLGDRLHILKRREIENYLLVPTAILAAIRAKHPTDANILEKVETARPEDVDASIRTAASELFGVVLMKRIRADVGGLREGFLPAAEVSRLASHAADPALPDLVLRSVQQTAKDRIVELGIQELVGTHRGALEREWLDLTRHVQLAPGEEILSRLFEQFGSTYSKRTDAARIASAMSSDEVDSEVAGVIERAAGLVA